MNSAQQPDEFSMPSPRWDIRSWPCARSTVCNRQATDQHFCASTHTEHYGSLSPWEETPLYSFGSTWFCLSSIARPDRWSESHPWFWLANQIWDLCGSSEAYKPICPWPWSFFCNAWHGRGEHQASAIGKTGKTSQHRCAGQHSGPGDALWPGASTRPS